LHFKPPRIYLLPAKNTILKVRKHFIKTFIWSMHLYVSEAFTITATAKEMWCFRRMMKVKRTERITDEEVLRREGGKKKTMNILTRRGRFIGHILRHSSPLKTVLEGEISG
jgi:hypothetical protein